MTDNNNFEIANMTNLYADDKQHLNRIGYKSFRGLVAVLKRVNKSCLKIGYKTEIRIVFPMKWR